jgi:hypothetical protein
MNLDNRIRQRNRCLPHVPAIRDVLGLDRAHMMKHGATAELETGGVWK